MSARSGSVAKGPGNKSVPGRSWLVLFHQIPPKPDYLRVRIGRALRSLGAVALKNTVYVLPAGPPFEAGLAGVVREIQARGGEAVACESRLVAGLSDAALLDRFREARDAEYADVTREASDLAEALRKVKRKTGDRTRQANLRLNRLRKRFEGIVARDPFGSAGRDKAAGTLSLVEDRIQGVDDAGKLRTDPPPPKGATWVTRAGPMIDRMASAWLIRRFIDPSARFKFVSGHGYRPERGEYRFDMAGAEFTHEGDRCTFEVLLDRFDLEDSALRFIGEIVHDLDLEDEKYRHPETSGVGRLVVGIALAVRDDQARLVQGAAVFNGLYESYRKQGPRATGKRPVSRGPAGRKSS